MHHEDEPELVSRSVQAGLGLFTGVVVYCTAFGGLFALVFAAANGRVGNCSPRAVAALLAAAGFVAIYLVPALKYPANPPSVGQPDTIDQRTALYFAMMLVSIAAMVGAVMLRNALARRHGVWSAALIAGAGYLVVVVAAQLLLPSINEVPEQFPAVLLWNFRIASLGTQAVMWATLGLLFGWLTERAAARNRGSARNMHFGYTTRAASLSIRRKVRCLGARVRHRIPQAIDGSVPVATRRSPLSA
jgi:predicted cobalt transporter CbtA